MPFRGNLSAALVYVTGLGVLIWDPCEGQSVLVMMSILIELFVREEKKRGGILAPTNALKCALLPLICKGFFFTCTNYILVRPSQWLVCDFPYWPLMLWIFDLYWFVSSVSVKPLGDMGRYASSHPVVAKPVHLSLCLCLRGGCCAIHKPMLELMSQRKAGYWCFEIWKLC